MSNLTRLFRLGRALLRKKPDPEQSAKEAALDAELGAVPTYRRRAAPVVEPAPVEPEPKPAPVEVDENGYVKRSL